MRHTMGWRIDGLNDQQRDRLITAHDMNDGYDWWNNRYETPPCGCLEGTISHGSPCSTGFVIQLHDDALATAGGSLDNVEWRIAPPSIRYPQAVARFGKERVVRAIKLRAAKPYRVQPTVVESPVIETVGYSPEQRASLRSRVPAKSPLSP